MPELVPFQEDGVKFLLDRPKELRGKPHRLLAWEQGLGKTPTACVAASLFGKRTLIVCPLAVKLQWAEHMIEWAGVDPDRIGMWGQFRPGSSTYILHYQQLLNEHIRTTSMGMDPWDTVIIDEVQRCKSLHSKTSQIILGKQGPVIGQGDLKIFLSGTIMPNRAMEFFPLLRAAAPECIDPYLTEESYGQRFCGAHWDGYEMNYQGSSNLDELRERLRPFMLRETIESVGLELPPIIESRRYVDIDLAQNEHDTAIATLRKLTGNAKVHATAQIITEKLEFNHNKIIVFAYSREVVEWLCARLAQFDAVMYYGGTKQDIKELALESFKTIDSCRVLVAQINAAGEGIDGLQHATNEIIFAEEEWSAGTWDQAVSRIRCWGQLKPVFVTRVIAVDSLDERILASYQRKKRDITKLLEPWEKKQMAEKTSLDLLCEAAIALLNCITNEVKNGKEKSNAVPLEKPDPKSEKAAGKKQDKPKEETAPGNATTTATQTTTKEQLQDCAYETLMRLEAEYKQQGRDEKQAGENARADISTTLKAVGKADLVKDVKPEYYGPVVEAFKTLSAKVVESQQDKLAGLGI